MKLQNVTPPAADVLDKQLLDRLITERAILQFAKENGVKVDDTQVERALLRIAQDNKLSLDEFRVALKREGIEYEKYREDIRKEIVIQRLRDREVDQRVTVSDSEVEAFLASQNAQAVATPSTGFRTSS
jgi:peptidyl-prolyl cis-trans isomerase SurA